MAKSSERMFVKIAISAKKELVCELVGKKLKNLDACEKCRLYMQTWVTLRCDHKVCYECFNDSPSYICSIDKKRTTKTRASTEGYDKLRNAEVYCPACPQKDTCGNLPKHIRSKHPELLESADESTKPLQIEVMAHSPRTPRRYDTKRVNHRWQNPSQTHEIPATTGDSRIQDDVDMVTDDESSDSIPPIAEEASTDTEIGTCTHCNTPLEMNDIPEHEEKCPDRVVECPLSSKKIALSAVQCHISTACPRREALQAMETLRKPTPRDYVDDKKEKKDITKATVDVQEMKDKLKELEQRMTALEEPLKLIIRRLS
nr:uncharacterized protein LOC119164150 [Rhipicephalus microplus]